MACGWKYEITMTKLAVCSQNERNIAAGILMGLFSPGPRVFLLEMLNNDREDGRGSAKNLLLPSFPSPPVYRENFKQLNKVETRRKGEEEMNEKR